MKAFVAAIAAAGLCSTPAAAQSVPPEHADEYARVVDLARFASDARICELLGYTVSMKAAEPAAQKLADEVKAGGVDEATATRWLNASMKIHGDALAQKFAKLTDALTTKSVMRPEVEGFFKPYVTRCAAASKDPILKLLVSAPANYDPEAGYRAAVDQLVAPGGEATWQTPEILARADLLTATAMCRDHLSKDEMAELTAGVVGQPTSADPAQARVQAYLAHAYTGGLEATDELDAQQCVKVIASFRQKVAAARRR